MWRENFRHIMTYRRPSLGAYFASQPLLLSSRDTKGDTWNVYAAPAAISLVLLTAETLYLAASLPETKGWRAVGEASRGAEGGDAALVPKDSAEKRLARLSAIGRLHGLFLLFFSGVIKFPSIAADDVLTVYRQSSP